MNDSDTRKLLRKHVIYGVRAAQQVVSVTAVEGAGANVAAVERYIVARGGRRVDARSDLAALGVASQAYWLLPPEMLAAA